MNKDTIQFRVRTEQDNILLTQGSLFSRPFTCGGCISFQIEYTAHLLFLNLYLWNLWKIIHAVLIRASNPSGLLRIITSANLEIEEVSGNQAIYLNWAFELIININGGTTHPYGIYLSVLSGSSCCLAKCPSTWHTDAEWCLAFSQSCAAGPDPWQPTGSRQYQMTHWNVFLLLARILHFLWIINQHGFAAVTVYDWNSSSTAAPQTLMTVYNLNNIE